MHKDIDNFLNYLKSAKNYSGHTIKSYENDLLKFNNFLLEKKFSITNSSLNLIPSSEIFNLPSLSLK